MGEVSGQFEVGQGWRSQARGNWGGSGNCEESGEFGHWANWLGHIGNEDLDLLIGAICFLCIFYIVCFDVITDNF